MLINVEDFSYLAASWVSRKGNETIYLSTCNDTVGPDSEMTNAASRPSANDDDGMPLSEDYQAYTRQPGTGGTAPALSEVYSSGQRRTVLVVDDEPTVRLLIAEVLDDLSYTSLEAIDGPSGLRIIRSDAPIDLMITDVGLPGGMTGRDLAAAARAERPGLAILFITGYAESAALGDGIAEPGTMVLTKPFSIDALTSHIRELISPGD